MTTAATSTGSRPTPRPMPSPRNRRGRSSSKPVDLLAKGLGEKKPWLKATPLFRNIVQHSGYSPIKDRAYDLMEKAQEGGVNELKEAYNQARQDQYADAKKSLDKVAKEYAG